MMKPEKTIEQGSSASRATRIPAILMVGGRSRVLCVLLIAGLGIVAWAWHKNSSVFARPQEVAVPGASAEDETGPDLDFDRRCHSPGVVKCAGFDSPKEIAPSVYNDSRGQLRALIDTDVKSSGRGSLRFEIPSHSGQNSSGGWTSGLGAAFGQGQTFYVQYRQRFSPEFLKTKYQDAEGWKQSIFHMGTSTCAAMEITTVNSYHRGYPQMYTNCGGRSFDVDLHNYDFLYETGDYNCHRSNPNPHDCAFYKANQWMTFYYEIKIGGWGKPDSTIKAWVGYEGEPLKQFENGLNYQLDFNSSPSDGFNAITLTPYNTGKSPAQDHPTAYTWYDELIVSRQPIPAPGQNTRHE
jgi:hypothetical protein